ncbi:shikimate kinase [Paenibacillus sp. RUD330]|nr:shikimate kinase [Paenibacillus sp. RUD330]
MGRCEHQVVGEDQPSRSKIVLVGFMGTGKSTVAGQLAGRLGYGWTDTDSEVVAAEGCSIAELFARHGEPYFRQAETRALTRLLTADTPLVIATGGGTVLSEANRELMLRHGFVAALRASEAVIVERVAGDTARPLLAGDPAAKVRELMKARSGAYDFAQLSVDTDGLDPGAVAESVLSGYLGTSGLYRVSE